MTELEQLTQLCQRLGAPGAQAATMAAQLLKRADQLVVERGLTRDLYLAPKHPVTKALLRAADPSSSNEARAS